MGVTIRDLHPTDRAAWGGLYRGYHEFYDRADLPGTFFDACFDRLIARKDADFRGLVADRGGELVGLVHFVFHPNLWRPEGVCYLQDLFTAPAARGQGVGAALIRATYDAADAAGVPSVYWMTAENNYAGRMLYDRVGVKTPFIRYNRPAGEAR
ncbi:GNAT family N-acetyltransferase [Paracoccus sp. (in: a-proteobacteria)]|uniref:GNAT family N-acetyltransferase n=1 Tax=Paracoccus sp. TaxID=267 RepID=UPI0026E0A732|nr:GNAT family N-acetyltransferase [Paracoccus sp. (in: a-proteobacteria)]MDO5648685.1 GNAT family N-acetyltransferase [Paracoccus sp. (in: a-proteobacteria)]